MTKRTSIVATIGPATEEISILEEMIAAGLNVARFNTKHSTPEWHNDRIKRALEAAENQNQPLGILLDLQGPEIRINLPGEASFDLKSGDKVIFTSDTNHQAKNFINVPQDVIESMSKDDLVMLDDGNCEFVITKVEKTEFEAETIHNCTVAHRKTMNTPGVILDMPSLTDRDYLYLEGVDLNNVDFVGLSFVRNKEDIDILKKELKKHNAEHCQIVAKIENQAALDNIDEIIEASDAIMVARGDLAVEVPFEELIYWQKVIIDKSRKAAKPVITATQMLKSMMNSPRPTRAEVSDVAHAIYDGTDAVMLSDETTIGKYPVKSVATQAQIANYNEKFATDGLLHKTIQTDTSSSIAHAAAEMLLDSAVEINKIICLTETGRTARLISRFRPLAPIYTGTSNKQTVRRLTLPYGIKPFLMELPEDRIEKSEDLLKQFKKAGIVESGELVLLISGTFWKRPGLTNTLSIVSIP